MNENLSLFKQFSNGNIHALDQLIDENHGLAMYFSNRYRFLSEKYADLDPDDIEQACLVGLWRGIIKWEPVKGALANSVAWRTKAEIQRLIGVRRKAEETGFLEREKSLDEELPEDDTTMVDLIRDENAIDPEEAACIEVQCSTFFQGLRDWADISDEDMKDLQDAVYKDKQPPAGLYARIRRSIFTPGSKAAKVFWRSWIDDRTTFLRTSTLSAERRSRTNHVSDPVADAVDKRELAQKQLDRLLGHVRKGG